MLNKNLKDVDLSTMDGVTKGDVNKCILYNSGKEITFGSTRGYYDVPPELFALILPPVLNSRNTKEMEELGIVSVWKDTGGGRYTIKEEFLAKEPKNEK